MFISCLQQIDAGVERAKAGVSDPGRLADIRAEVDTQISLHSKELSELEAELDAKWPNDLDELPF